ncbi:MAG: ribbon-helix-helix protein, CopG family [Gemmatimonadota bacterium]|nr:ribbon-helix-helix protein, CopG family [Gemmatimonadota bacterium]
MTPKKRPKAGGPARVGEPVQVYLAPSDQERLERLARRLDASKSEVLRRGLSALEALTRPGQPETRRPPALPTFRGRGLQPGVCLDESAALLDLMDDTRDTP